MLFSKNGISFSMQKVSMDLFYVLLNIQEFAEDGIIYAEKPWHLQSNAKVITDSLPTIINDEKLEYFLEIFIVLELFEEMQTSNTCLQDQCLRIIEYAIHDA